MGYEHIVVPSEGEKITLGSDDTITVPDNPIIPFIVGDGIGIDITPVMVKVVDAAVEKAYGGKRKIAWMEIYSGEKALEVYGEDQWLPAETLDAMREFIVGIKGPMGSRFGTLELACSTDTTARGTELFSPIALHLSVTSPVHEEPGKGKSGNRF